MTAEMHERVEHNMTNHAPTSPSVVETFEQLRESAKAIGFPIPTEPAALEVESWETA